MKSKILLLTLGLSTLFSFGQQLNNDYVKFVSKGASAAKPLITTLNNGNYLVAQGTVYSEIEVTSGNTVKGGYFSTNVSVPKSIVTNADHIYLGGSDNKTPQIVKMDMNMDTVWSTGLHSTSTYTEGVSSILVDGADVYAAGSFQSSKLFISKLNSTTGDTLWNTVLPQTTFSNLTSIIKLTDGNFLASGNVDDYPIAFKFTPKGDTLWSYTEFAFISFNKMSAFEQYGGTDVVLLARNQFITLDAATGVKKSQISTGNVDFYDVLKTGIDTLYMFGTHKNAKWGGNQYAVVEVRYLSLDSVKSYTYTNNVHPLVNNNFSRAVSLGGIEFAATGLVRDSVNLSANEWNIVAAKFNGTGAVSTTELNPTKKTTLYPNPTDGLINFNEVVHHVIVYSTTGQSVLNYSNNSNVVDLSGLTPGTYLIKWTNKSGEVSQQVVAKK